MLQSEFSFANLSPVEMDCGYFGRVVHKQTSNTDWDQLWCTSEMKQIAISYLPTNGEIRVAGTEIVNLYVVVRL